MSIFFFYYTRGKLTSHMALSVDKGMVSCPYGNNKDKRNDKNNEE